MPGAGRHIAVWAASLGLLAFGAGGAVWAASLGLLAFGAGGAVWAQAPDAWESPAVFGGGVSDGLRVELRAQTMVMLSAPAAGKLVNVPVRDGDAVRKGDLLVQIDDRLHRLRLDIARASRHQAETQLKLAEKLHDLGSRGALDVEMARAQFEGADAEVKLAAALVDLCRVTAPWNGRISQLEVRENQHVPEGAPLLEITEDGPLEVEFMMPSSWIAAVGRGSKLQIRVDETGRTYQAEVRRLGGKIDPLTQSVRVYAGLLEGDDDGRLLPGMTGALIPPEQP